ncbi:FGGY-family carbohydrate kinase [Streptomyces sp. NPDC047982]|uniref:FGGY-family carbohydrate kinase n=1 Tax=Streptomyces sp. NPDC047982 TaxID=3365495 RepID=UPI003717694D
MGPPFGGGRRPSAGDGPAGRTLPPRPGPVAAHARARVWAATGPGSQPRRSSSSTSATYGSVYHAVRAGRGRSTCRSRTIRFAASAFQRLTGVRATDVSDASMPFLDPMTRTYSADVVAALGLGHRAALLAPVSDPVATAELPSGVRISNGPYDLPACALGAGVTRPGDGLLIVGMCLAALVATERLDLDGEPAGLHISTDRPGHWLRAMPAMAGTAALDWVLATTGVRHTDVDRLLTTTPPGANGVRVRPYFAPSGERAPFLEPRLRAEFLGVCLETTAADLVRAVCEGIGFAARHCLDAAGLTGTLALCGGGTRSPAWTRLFADVLGRPLRIVEGEVGARGAVLSAARRFGAALDTAAWTAPREVVEPDPARAAFYAKAYEDHLTRLAEARTRARARA